MGRFRVLGGFWAVSGTLARGGCLGHPPPPYPRFNVARGFGSVEGLPRVGKLSTCTRGEGGHTCRPRAREFGRVVPLGR